MTRAEALIDIIADVDATIAHWKAIGVSGDDIGKQLLCRKNWPSIRRRMIRLALPFHLRVIENELIALADRSFAMHLAIPAARKARLAA